MSLASKNKTISWQPSASIENLRVRARVLKVIRDFFDQRCVMEVETPLISHTSVTDPYIESIPVLVQTHTHAKTTYYLQTSPEYAMKRLLAAGSGSIYQITKAFRQGEIGRYHNPEFSMLEWYRPQFDHHALMDEVEALLCQVLKTKTATRISYQTLFETRLHINPHLASIDELKTCAHANHLNIESAIADKDTWLQILMTHCIEPHLGFDRPCFIYDFPASQAALSRIIEGKPPLAARFEVYAQGLELANGFHELQDANEQRKRFELNLIQREKQDLPLLPIDEYFLSALTHGLPDCAGVALGIDRLMMLATQSEHLADILSFDFQRA